MEIRVSRLKLETYKDACDMVEGILSSIRKGSRDPDYSRAEIIARIEHFHLQVAEDNGVEVVCGRADIDQPTKLSAAAKKQARALEGIWDFMHGFY